MWEIFSTILEDKINLHIPTVNNFDSWKKKNRVHPLGVELRSVISK